MDKTDYFLEQDGLRFAGTHILLDCWESSHLNDPIFIEKTLIRAAEACGATVLHSHSHAFMPNNGVTGIVMLAESHISIHTWPEHDFASIDVFMCGKCDPRKAVPIIKEAFCVGRMTISDMKRGIID